MILILIRHGETAANEKHLYCGKTDIGLSDNGIEALKKKHGRLYFRLPTVRMPDGDMNEASTVRMPDGDVNEASTVRMLTSGMKRCEQTLKLLFGDIPHETDPAFREMDFGAFEMRSYEELKTDPEYITWISGDNESNITPGGESGKMMQLRVLKGLKRVVSEKRDTLLVTHGGVIAVIMSFLFPEENKNRYEWQPEPGTGYVINIDDEGRAGNYQIT